MKMPSRINPELHEYFAIWSYYEDNALQKDIFGERVRATVFLWNAPLRRVFAEQFSNPDDRGTLINAGAVGPIRASTKLPRHYYVRCYG